MRIVDTSVAVDHLRGHAPATTLLEDLIRRDAPLLSSEVVRVELLAGVRPSDEERVEQFCSALDWLPVTEAVTREAAVLARRYRGSHGGIDDVDYLLGATTLLVGGELLTTNVRHFPMLDGLRTPY